MEGDGMLAIDGHLDQVFVPDLARIAPQILGLDAVETMPGARNVLGRERLAVVPGDARPEREAELGARGVPGPAFGQLGDDAIEGVARLVRVETHQVVE